MNLERRLLRACFMGWASIFRKPKTIEPGSSCNGANYQHSEHTIDKMRKQLLSPGDAYFKPSSCFNTLQPKCDAWGCISAYCIRGCWEGESGTRISDCVVWYFANSASNSARLGSLRTPDCPDPLLSKNSWDSNTPPSVSKALWMPVEDSQPQHGP